jgi:hypothetical protein
MGRSRGKQEEEDEGRGSKLIVPQNKSKANEICALRHI